MRKQLSRLSSGLAKTRQAIVEGIRRALGGSALTEEALGGIEETLIAADLGVDTSLSLVGALRSRAGPDSGTEEDVRRFLSERIEGMLGAPGRGGYPSGEDRPLVLMVVGVNGVGKTTSIGKLARRYTSDGGKVVLAAADTFRAAAVEQLSIWADRAGAEFVGGQEGGDPAAVAYDALDAAVARDADVLIVDTAGRLHTQKNLMQELVKIRRVLGRRLPEAPHEVLLVLDANTGQNAVSQARLFHEALGLTGIVLAKLDGTARGGIVVPIVRDLGVPVRLVGTGEGLEDMEEFDASLFARALLGIEEKRPTERTGNPGPQGADEAA